MDKPGRWVTATKDLKGRICRGCLKGIIKGDSYRRWGLSTLGQPVYEHSWCVRLPRGRQQPKPKPKVIEFGHNVATYRNTDGSEHVGRGVNFPGLVAEWEWLRPEPGFYRLRVAQMAMIRRQQHYLTDPELSGALAMVASRLSEGHVDTVRLAAECEEATREFEQPPGLVLYCLASIGVVTLIAERVDDLEVAHFTEVEVRDQAAWEGLARVVKGEGDEREGED